MLNPLQRDALTELVNVYVGYAASLLSEMVGLRIILSVPRVELISETGLEGEEILPKIFSPGHIVSSHVEFGQDFQGKAFLVFPVQQAKLLVNACMGEELPLGGGDEDSLRFLDTDFDVLKEISNLILNAIVGEFGNLLQTRVMLTVPEVELVDVTESAQRVFLQDRVYILVLHTDFTVAEIEAHGVIMIALNLNSVSHLLKKIDSLLEG